MNFAQEDTLFLAQAMHNLKRIGGTKQELAIRIDKSFNEPGAFRRLILSDTITFKGALESVLGSDILSDSVDNTNSTITLTYKDSNEQEESDNYSYSKIDGKYEFYRLTESGGTIVQGGKKNLEDFSQFVFNALKADVTARIHFNV